jgi:hypothetical protein
MVDSGVLAPSAMGWPAVSGTGVGAVSGSELLTGSPAVS